MENLDVSKALREALDGAGVPAKWLRDEDVVAMRAQEAKQAAAGAQQAAVMEQAGKAAAAMGQAAQAVDPNAAMF
jgi:hypothetical protein